MKFAKISISLVKKDFFLFLCIVKIYETLTKILLSIHT